MKRNTIDYDFSAKYQRDLNTFYKVIAKIIEYGVIRWRCLKALDWKDSSSKGMHIILRCRVNCDLCRFVFDDQERYRKDLKRKPYANNVLWSRKY